MLIAAGSLLVTSSIALVRLNVMTSLYSLRVLTVKSGSEYNSLASLLDDSNSAHAELLAKIKRRLRNETFTMDYIREIIHNYPLLVRSLYLNFANRHYVQTHGDQDELLPTLSYLRLKVDRILPDEELKALISKTVANEHHEMVMTAFRIFNSSVL